MSLVEDLLAHLSRPTAAERAAGLPAAQRAPRPERRAVLRLLLDDPAHLDGALDLMALGDAVLRDWLHRACWIQPAHRLVWQHHLLGHPLPDDLHPTLSALADLTAPEGGAALPPDAAARVALGHGRRQIEAALQQRVVLPPQTRALPWRMAEALAAGQDAAAFWAAQVEEHRLRAVSVSLSLLAPWHAAPARLCSRFAEVAAFRTLEARWRADWAALAASAAPEVLQRIDLDQRQAFSQAIARAAAREQGQFRRHVLALAGRCPTLVGD